jgi:Protein of unknown function (DUF2569)
MQTCPRCSLINVDTAVLCDCGYDFRSRRMPAAPGMADGAEGPRGFGGWLIVFVIAMIGSLIAFLMGFFATIDELARPTPLVLKHGYPYYSPMWRGLMLGELFYMAAGIAALCWLAVLFFRQKVSFPRCWVRVNVLLAGRRRPRHHDEASVPRTNVACGFPALRSTGRLPAPRRAARSRMKFRRR